MTTEHTARPKTYSVTVIEWLSHEAVVAAGSQDKAALLVCESGIEGVVRAVKGPVRSKRGKAKLELAFVLDTNQ